MPDPKKPPGVEPEPDEEAHGSELARTFREIEADLASEEGAAVVADRGTVET
jgi:hypothetical protein